MDGTNASRGRHRSGEDGSIFRWVCRCQDPPVLLATYDPEGRVHIKVRDRYWHIVGQVQAICRRCGADHLLDLRGTAAADPTRKIG